MIGGMGTLALGTLVVCLALGRLVNEVLYAPWRVKPLSSFLYKHWAWYRRFRRIESMRAMTRAVRAAEKVIGQRLLPAIESVGYAMRDWLEAYKVAATREP